MRLTDMGPLALTLFASLFIAVILLALRVLVMGRVQTQRQRENRQETERLKSLVAAYRSMAGSFSPAAAADRLQLEEALADIVLFGSLSQVEQAAACATCLVRGEPVDTQPLVEALRADLRVQLGLEAIPAELMLPHSGPARAQRNAREGEARAAAGVAGASVVVVAVRRPAGWAPASSSAAAAPDASPESRQSPSCDDARC